jgi:hypothetical protein
MHISQFDEFANSKEEIKGDNHTSINQSQNQI